jgi:hypothetical protein
MLALTLLLVSAFAHAKVEDPTEQWVNSWVQSERGLAHELQYQRASMLRVIHHFLTDSGRDSGQWMVLMREEPDSELSEAITDLVRMNSVFMREIDLNQFFRDLALQGDLIYMSGHNLSESGVTLSAMKEALQLYLRSLKADWKTTVLKVNIEDLRLSSRPTPEYRLIFDHIITMLRQENVDNFRLVVSGSPDAWNYVFATYELAMPIFSLEDQDRVQVIDGSKLEVMQSCASLVEETQ